MKRIGLLSGLLAATLVGCEQDHSTRTASNTGDNSLTAMARPASAELPKAANSTIATTGSKFETVATFTGPMPTGVTVSHERPHLRQLPALGRPRRVHGRRVGQRPHRPLPDPGEQAQQASPTRTTLVAVQSVVVDPATGCGCWTPAASRSSPCSPGGPKLVGIDLERRTASSRRSRSPPTSPCRRPTSTTSASTAPRQGGLWPSSPTPPAKGPNGIIVVDLDPGKSWRRLNDHPSTKGVPNFLPVVEGRSSWSASPGGKPKPLKMGSDGIAISPDGKTLYYCPLSSRKLYVVSVDALCDPNKSDAEVAKTVQLVGTKAACDGMETDSRNRILTTVTKNTIPSFAATPMATSKRSCRTPTHSLARYPFSRRRLSLLHREPT